MDQSHYPSALAQVRGALGNMRSPPGDREALATAVENIILLSFWRGEIHPDPNHAAALAEQFERELDMFLSTENELVE